MVTNFTTTYWVYKDRSGHWRWQLVHNSNGKIIADSGEGYANRNDCLHGIDITATSRGSAVKDR
ncbi:MAG TPA: DUF1508 domain-containing protein [Sphingomicrobium sp.]|nr:DUF1508 domain-containing protein [Sphingomicrobium sp.]